MIFRSFINYSSCFSPCRTSCLQSAASQQTRWANSEGMQRTPGRESVHLETRDSHISFVVFSLSHKEVCSVCSVFSQLQARGPNTVKNCSYRHWHRWALLFCRKVAQQNLSFSPHTPCSPQRATARLPQSLQLDLKTVKVKPSFYFVLLILKFYPLMLQSAHKISFVDLCLSCMHLKWSTSPFHRDERHSWIWALPGRMELKMQRTSPRRLKVSWLLLRNWGMQSLTKM